MPQTVSLLRWDADGGAAGHVLPAHELPARPPAQASVWLAPGWHRASVSEELLETLTEVPLVADTRNSIEDPLTRR